MRCVLCHKGNMQINSIPLYRVHINGYGKIRLRMTGINPIAILSRCTNGISAQYAFLRLPKHNESIPKSVAYPQYEAYKERYFIFAQNH
jgi:hypothetical protein